MEIREKGTGLFRQKAAAWTYIYLPVFFCCHCRDDRSFHFRGRKFPICARCTGMGAGFLLAIVTLWIAHPPVPILLLVMIPMILDGSIQQLTRYESTNRRRFITGLLFGYGAMLLLILSYLSVLKYGFRLGRKWKMEGSPVKK